MCKCVVGEEVGPQLGGVEGQRSKYKQRNWCKYTCAQNTHLQTAKSKNTMSLWCSMQNTDCSYITNPNQFVLEAGWHFCCFAPGATNFEFFFNFKRIFHGICAQSPLSQQQFDWQDVILCHLFCQRPWMKPEGFWRQIVTLRTDSSPREAKSLQHCQWLWRLPKANRGQQRPSNGSILYLLPQFLATLVALHVASRLASLFFLVCFYSLVWHFLNHSNQDDFSCTC